MYKPSISRSTRFMQLFLDIELATKHTECHNIGYQATVNVTVGCTGALKDIWDHVTPDKGTLPLMQRMLPCFAKTQQHLRLHP